MKDTRTAIYTKLAADTAGAGNLSTLVGTRIYYGKAPTSALFPFLIFFFNSGEIPEYSFGGIQTEESLVTVKGVATSDTSTSKHGQQLAEEIAERARTVLQDASLTLSSNSLKYLRRERAMPPYTEKLQNDQTVYHVGDIYRLVTSPN